MKHALTVLVASMLLSFSVNAQTKQWLDANLRVTPNEKDAVYYQVVNKDGTYKVFQTNGTINQEGKFLSYDEQYTNGTIKFYDSKGNFLKSRDYVHGLVKAIPLYTGDIKEAYSYMGMVYQYEQPGTGANAYDEATRLGLENLSEKCRDLGADAVVNMHIELSKLDNTPRLTIYGTAVKMK
jgi:uncharacterized protein YbjQ (UPF0145 family)